MINANAAPWEIRLFDMAYAGIHSPVHAPCPIPSTKDLTEAYRHCSQITAAHSRTFSLASGLLPPQKRAAARALYAFCRTTDDIVDRQATDEHIRAEIEQWQRQAEHLSDVVTEPFMLAWYDIQARYQIPSLYVTQLIEGVSRDIHQNRYETFEDLTTYCYGVASTVGLMAMHIIGFTGPEAIPYAVKLGVALQLTNILRDIAEDWAGGRLYLPLEELEAFNLSPADLAIGEVTEDWRAFMCFQIARVRRLYEDALPGIQMLHRDGRFAIGAAAELYAAILNDIEAHHMDVFRRRAYVTTGEKLRKLPGIWWRATIAGHDHRPADKAALNANLKQGLGTPSFTHPTRRPEDHK